MASTLEEHLGIELVDGQLRLAGPLYKSDATTRRVQENPRRTAIAFATLLNRIDLSKPPCVDTVEAPVRLLIRAARSGDLFVDDACFDPQVDEQVQLAIVKGVCRLLSWLDPYLHAIEMRVHAESKFEVKSISSEWPPVYVFPLQDVVMLWDGVECLASRERTRSTRFLEDLADLCEWAVPSSESVALAASCVILLTKIVWTDCLPRERLRKRIDETSTKIWQESRSLVRHNLDGIMPNFERAHPHRKRS